MNRPDIRLSSMACGVLHLAAASALAAPIRSTSPVARTTRCTACSARSRLQPAEEEQIAFRSIQLMFVALQTTTQTRTFSSTICRKMIPDTNPIFQGGDVAGGRLLLLKNAPRLGAM